MFSAVDRRQSCAPYSCTSRSGTTLVIPGFPWQLGDASLARDRVHRRHDPLVRPRGEEAMDVSALARHDVLQALLPRGVVADDGLLLASFSGTNSAPEVKTGFGCKDTG